MFAQIKGLKIQSKYFEQETPLKILEAPFNLLYGRNGSGKSTIARALQSEINKENNEEYDTTSNFHFYDANSALISLTDMSKNIHVFNDKFIEDSVSFKEDGLGTIVMLGEDVDIEKQLQQAEKDFEKNNKIFDEKTTELDEIEASGNHYVKIREDVRNNLRNNWAARDRDIREKHNKTSVRDDLLDKIINRDNLTNINKSDTDKNILDNSIKKAVEIIGGVSDYSEYLKQLPTFTEFDFTKSLDIASRKVLNSNLEEHEQEFLDKWREYITKSRDVFNETDICPLCFSEIDETKKTSIFEKLFKFLNQETQIFEAEVEDELRLNHEFVKNLTDNYLDNEELGKYFNDKETYKVLEGLISKYTSEIGVCCDILNNKKTDYKKDYGDNIRTLIKRIETKCLVTDIENSIKQINDIIASHNQALNDIAQVKASAQEANDKLAFIENRHHISLYFSQLDTYTKKNNKIKQLKNDLTSLSSRITELKQRKANTKEAMNFINQSLQCIFYNKSRLYLEEGDECYKLKSRDKEIKPKDVSTGEKNAIALAYFFITILRGLDPKQIENEAFFLLIDDPISSFDSENKVGVITLLRLHLTTILKNASSKVLLCSHDFQALLDISKFCKDKKSLKAYRLKNKESKEFFIYSDKYESLYHVLLRDIYNFAIDENPDDNNDKYAIGNKMRQVFEAISTFLYKSGFDQMLKDEHLINKIKTKDERDYLRNFMFRLVLNNHSHAIDAIKTMNYTQQHYSGEELRTTAKCLLKFLLYTHEKHFCSYFTDNKEINEIKGWKTTNANS